MPGAVRVRDRPAHLHRLPCLHRGLQDRARGARRSVPHLGEVRGEGRVPRHDPRVRRDAVQPLHRRALREDLPDARRSTSATTASSTSTATAASAARAACRPAPTTRSTSTRTPTPRPSATSAPTASTTTSSRPASSSARPTRSGSATSTTRPSGISRLVNANPTSVRSPEQNTGPNVFYLGADRAVLDPLDAPVDDTYIWSHPDAHRLEVAADTPARGRRRRAHDATTPRIPGRGAGRSRPTSGPRASPPAPCWSPRSRRSSAPTSACSARSWPRRSRWSPLAATGVLLVWDLKRPERFLYLFLKPNPTSWLFWGAVALAVLRASSPGSGSSPAWPASWTCRRRDGAGRARLAGDPRRGDGRRLHRVPLRPGRGPRPLAVAAAVLAPAGAGAHGRRRGAGAWRCWSPTSGRTPTRSSSARWRWPPRRTSSSLAVEYGGRHATRHAAAAAHMVTHGRYAAAVLVGGRRAWRARRRGWPFLSWNGGHLRRRRGRRPRSSRSPCSRTRACSCAPARTSPSREGARHDRRAVPPRRAHRTRTCATSRRRSTGTPSSQRRQGAPAQGAARVHAGADHVLQLRVRVRAAGLRGQGGPVHQEGGGQPGAPRLARPQLRQGPGDDQPDQRPRADPAPAAPGRRRAAAASGSGSAGTTALDDIAGRIRTAITEGRGNEVMYHVGPPGEDGFAERFLMAWGVDGHNTHTNICSSGARLGQTLWGGLRPAVAGLRERQGHPAAVQPPRDRALLQPARAADHGGQARRRAS